jgi:hypothetical protein
MEKDIRLVPTEFAFDFNTMTQFTKPLRRQSFLIVAASCSFVTSVVNFDLFRTAGSPSFALLRRMGRQQTSG